MRSESLLLLAGARPIIIPPSCAGAEAEVVGWRLPDGRAVDYAAAFLWLYTECSAPPFEVIKPCSHEREILDRDENGDRVRTNEICRTCGHGYYGCLAKRLDDEGREAWGTPGVQGYWLSDA